MVASKYSRTGSEWNSQTQSSLSLFSSITNTKSSEPIVVHLTESPAPPVRIAGNVPSPILHTRSNLIITPSPVCTPPLNQSTVKQAPDEIQAQPRSLSASRKTTGLPRPLKKKPIRQGPTKPKPLQGQAHSKPNPQRPVNKKHSPQHQMHKKPSPPGQNPQHQANRNPQRQVGKKSQLRVNQNPKRQANQNSQHPVHYSKPKPRLQNRNKKPRNRTPSAKPQKPPAPSAPPSPEDFTSVWTLRRVDDYNRETTIEVVV